MGNPIDSLRDNRFLVNIPASSGILPPLDDNAISGDRFFGDMAVINAALIGVGALPGTIDLWLWIFDTNNGWILKEIIIMSLANNLPRCFLSPIGGQTWSVTIPVLPVGYTGRLSLCAIPGNKSL